MRGRKVALLMTTVVLSLNAGCAARQRPKELVALEQLRASPTFSESDRRAFDLLAAADDLLVRAEGEWEHGSLDRARRDALMGKIKMETALAIRDADRTSERITELNAELAASQDEEARLGDQLATVNEELALLERLKATRAAAAAERKTFAEQVDTAKKRAASDGDRMAQQLATEKHRGEALDSIRRAELALHAAETVDSPHYAKAKYTAAAAMLQEAHKEFDAGHWDEALARTTLARTEAEGGTEIARPLYEKATAALNNRARDRALEADATAVPGVETRLERDGDLQRLVLVLGGLFVDKLSVLSPEGARILDAVKELLARYPSYAAQVTGFTDDRGPPADLAALSLARANAVYWALVARGVEPRRLSVDGKGPADPADDNSTPSGRRKNSRIELSLLYHIAP
jgi:outer membrane protein OmpA-like peptidoglycan-associated protein